MVLETMERTDEGALVAPPSRRMTFEEFLAWCDEDTWAEWVDGEVTQMSPASNTHQDVALFLSNILNAFAEAHELGILRPAPFLMRLATRPSGREPDLMFVAREHLHRLQETYLDGPADLAIEIISPESGARDRVEKFSEYATGGVLEYWLIDAVRRQAEFYQLDEANVYRLAPADAQGVYHSRVLTGLWLRVDWLWPPSRPRLLEVLKGWALV